MKSKRKGEHTTVVDIGQGNLDSASFLLDTRLEILFALVDVNNRY